MSKVVSFTVTIDGVEKQIKNLGQLEETLKAVKKNSKTVDFGTKDLQAYQKAQGALVAQQVKHRAEVNRLKNENLALDKTYRGQSARLINLRNRYKDLAIQNKQNTVEGRALLRNITNLDQKLKGIDASVGQYQRNVGNYFGAFQRFGGQLTRLLGVGSFLTIAQQGVREVINTIQNFEQALANLDSIANPTTEQLAALKQQSLELGATTAFTATQVLELQTELAKLGFTTDEIINASLGVENLAIATGSNVPEAAALAGSTLRAFGLDASETDRVVSALAVSTTKSALDFQKLNTALPQVSAVAATTGVTLEETIGLLGTLSNAGLDASQSGTSLRNIFLTLAKEGITLQEAFDLVAHSQDSASTALDLFGKRGAAAALILTQNQNAAKNLEGSIQGVNDELQEMVDKRLDTAQGEITLLKSAWEGAILAFDSGEGVLNDVVKSVVRFVRQIFTAFTENIDRFRDAFRPFMMAWGELFDLFRGERSTAEAMNDVMKGLARTLKAALTPTVLVVRAITSLTKGFKNLIDSSPFLQRLLQGIGTQLSNIGKGISLLPNIFAGVQNALSVMVQNWKLDFEIAWINIQLLAARAKALFSNSAKELVKDLEKRRDDLKKAGKSMREAFNEGFNSVKFTPTTTVTESGGDGGNTEPSVVVTKEAKELLNQGNGEDPKRKKKKAVKAAEGSIAALQKEVADLNKKILASNDQSFIEKTVEELGELEHALFTAKALLEDLKDNTDGIDRGNLKQLEKIGPIDPVARRKAQIQEEIELEAARIRTTAKMQDEANTARILREKLVLDEVQKLVANTANRIFELQKETIDREFEASITATENLYNRRIEAAQGDVQLQQALERELTEEREKIEERAAKKRKAVAIKEAIIQTALAIIEALPNPFAAGFAAAAGAVQLATIQSQTFAEGGFTGPGKGKPDRTGHVPVGVVHANEYVLPPKVVKSPEGRVLTGIAEILRARHGYSRGRPTRLRPGYAGGGFTKAPVGMARTGFTVSLDADSVALLGQQVAIGSEAGTASGTQKGIRRANEESRLLSQVEKDTNI